MHLNIFNSRNDRHDEEARPPVLVEITSQRAGERTVLGVENLLGSVADAEPCSLELAGSAGGVSVMARCNDGDVLRGQLGAHYPQARVREVPPEEDPLRLDEGEQAYTTTLRSAGPEYVPLRTFNDRDLTEPGSDPLLALFGALADLNEDERVVTRMRLRPLGPDWAVHHQRLAQERPAAPSSPPPTAGSPAAHTPDVKQMLFLVFGGFAALQAYVWLRADETWKVVLMGLGILALAAAAIWVKVRFFKTPRVYAPALVAEKISRTAFEADIQVTVILPSGGKPQRAAEIMKRITAAYRHYNNPAGASFAIGETEPTDMLDTSLEPAPRRFLSKRSVFGIREAAVLWHPPEPLRRHPPRRTLGLPLPRTRQARTGGRPRRGDHRGQDAGGPLLP